MPCCAFAAFIAGQLLLALGAIRRIVGGRDAAGDDRSAVNETVEWRLERAARSPEDRAPAAGTPKATWRPGRLAVPIFALAALIELALVFGALYGVRAHFGHVHHNTVEASPR